MRYVNRRRLLIVVVLAALFGAALPYLELVINEHVDIPGHKQFASERGQVRVLGSEGALGDIVITTWLSEVPLTSADWDSVLRTSHGLVPVDVFEIRRALRGEVVVSRHGWPFRAAHMCRVWDFEAGKGSQPSSTMLERTNVGNAWANNNLPVEIPKGVLVLGAIGNICVSIGLFATLYCGLAYWRAHRRIKRGKCWKCGYLSSGAAVCPECGAGVKA